MGNTDDKKEVELKQIPRNPNIPIKDDEVAELLKKAAEQLSDKSEGASVQSDGKAIKENKNITSDVNKKDSETSKTDKTVARENIDLKEKEDKKSMGTTDGEFSGNQSDKSIDKKDGKSEKEKKLSHEKKTVDKDDSDKKKISNSNNSGDLKKKSDLAQGAKKSSATKDNQSSNATKKSIDKTNKEKDFKIEDDVYVTKQPAKKEAVSEKSYKMTVGDVIGSVLEGIWTGIKLIVVITIATAIVGFFMSRDLMIRGRSGEQISKQNMNVAPATLSTRLEERQAGKSWNETVEKEKLTLEADDGKILVAQKIVINKSNDNWVVILHGQNGSVEDIYDIGLRYATEGYNVFMPDLRAHGESEGSYYGMGWLDRLDVINWIDVILKDNPSANIIIHGVDLGADTALMLSGEPIKESIKCIVAEGAYTSAWDAVKTEYKARHQDWPTFPMMHMLNPVAKVWGGYSLTEADAVEQVAKTDVPILLIRGQNDTYVTEDMTKELDQAIASEHEVLTITTGTHDDCRFAEPDNYYNKVFEFITRYVK